MKVLDWTETFGIYSKLILASVVSLDRTDMQEPSHAEVLHIIRYIMGYNWQYFKIIGYIKQTLNYILDKIMGYIWQNYRIYLINL